jgi:hypothetical protein
MAVVRVVMAIAFKQRKMVVAKTAVANAVHIGVGCRV